MKRFIKSITAAIVMATVALTSCMKQESIVPEVTSDDAISFGTFVDQTTKGTIFHTSDMQESGFGLMGFHTYQEAWDGASTTDFIMYNQLVEYNTTTSAWTYSPVKYWSNISGDYYSFFAYAPYSTSTAANGNIEVSDNTTTDIPVVSFTIDADPTKMVDFVAGQEVDIEQTEDVVRFDLKHQLTRVSFSAKTDITTDESKNTDATYVVIKDMDLAVADNFYLSGDYTFDLTNSTVLHDDHEQDGVWSNLVASEAAYDFSSLLAVSTTAIGSVTSDGVVEKTGYTTSGVRVANTNASETSLLTTGQYLFLLPPNGQTGIETAGDVAITVSYDIVTADASLPLGYSVYATKTATVMLPAAALKQGRAYDILLTFDLTEIKAAGNVIKWDESDSSDDYEITTGLDENIEEEEEEEEETTITPGEGYKLNDDGLYDLPDMIVNGTHEIDATASPEGTISWTSSDETVAKVDSYGVVTGVAGGIAIITGMTEDGTKIEFAVAVYYSVYQAFAMTLNPNALALTAGGDTGSTAIVYSYAQENFIEQYDIAWDSTTPAYATVSDGVVTPLSVGRTYISATATGSLSNTTVTSGWCTVDVSEPAPVVSLLVTYDGLADGEIAAVYVTPTATIQLDLATENLPADATITWTSSEESVATVDEDGLATISAYGTTTFTATYEGVSSSITITFASMTGSLDPTYGGSNI